MVLSKCFFAGHDGDSKTEEDDSENVHAESQKKSDQDHDTPFPSYVEHLTLSQCVSHSLLYLIAIHKAADPFSIFIWIYPRDQCAHEIAVTNELSLSQTILLILLCEI